MKRAAWRQHICHLGSWELPPVLGHLAMVRYEERIIARDAEGSVWQAKWVRNREYTFGRHLRLPGAESASTPSEMPSKTLTMAPF